MMKVEMECEPRARLSVRKRNGQDISRWQQQDLERDIARWHELQGNRGLCRRTVGSKDNTYSTGPVVGGV